MSNIDNNEQVIDIHNKKYKTKGGSDVTFITDKGHEAWSIVGYIGNNSIPTCWRSNGHRTCWRSNGHRYYGECGRCLEDLVEYIEPKILRCWVNFYEELGVVWSGSFDDLESATTAARKLQEQGHKILAIAVEVTKEITGL